MFYTHINKQINTNSHSYISRLDSRKYKNGITVKNSLFNYISILLLLLLLLKVLVAWDTDISLKRMTLN